MTLLTPLGLLGLLALPILFLMHRNAHTPARREVPSIRFWREAAGIAGEKPTRRFRITRLLALQMMIVALLSLAAASPQVRLPEWLGRRVPVHHIVLLDASVSMLAGDGNGTRFERALEDIQRLAGGSGSADVFSLIRLGSPVSVVAGPLTGRGDFLAAVEDFRPGEFSIDNAMGAAVARSLMDERLENRFYIFTDAAYELPVELGGIDDLDWYIYSEGNTNQAIVTAETTLLPSGRLTALVGVANFDGQMVSRTLGFSVGGVDAGAMPIQIPANSTIYIRQELAGNRGIAVIELLGDDDQSADDEWTIVEANGETARVEIVTSNPAWWQGRLVWPGISEVQISDPLNWVTGRGVDIVIFDGYVPDELPVGVVVLSSPTSEIEGFDAGKMCDDGGGLVSHDEVFLAQYELQGLRSPTVIEFNVDSLLDRVLISAGGCPLWLSRKAGDSQVYIYLGSTSAGSEIDHSSFPIVLARLAGWVVGNPVEPGNTLTSFLSDLHRISWSELNVALPDEGGEDSLGGGWEVIRNTGLGIYTAEGITSSGRTVRRSFILNGGDATESDINSREWADQYTGVPVWHEDAGEVGVVSPYILIAALALVFWERSIRRRNHD